MVHSSLSSPVANSDLHGELTVKLLVQLDRDDSILILPLIIATLLLLVTFLAVGRLLARLFRAKDLHSADACIFGSVVKAASDLEHAIFVGEFDLRSRFLLNAIAVVKVQLAAGFAVAVRSHDEVERLGADFGGGKSTLRAERNDGTAADVEWDFGEADVFELDLSAFAFDDLPSVEGVETIVGEVDGDACAVLFRDGRDEDVGAVEELQGVAEDVGVVGVGEEERVDERGAVNGLLVKGSVDVVEQTVTDVVSVASSFSNCLPKVEFLRDGGITIVVAREWVECWKMVSC